MPDESTGNFGHIVFHLIVLYDGPRQIEDGTWMGADFSVGPNGDGQPWEFVLRKRFELPDQESVDSLRAGTLDPSVVFRSGLREKARSVILALNLHPDVDGHYSILATNGGWSSNLPGGRSPLCGSFGSRCGTLEHPKPLSELSDASLQFDYGSLQMSEPVLKTMLELFDAGKSLRAKHARLSLLNFFKVLEAKAWAEKRAETSLSIADKDISTGSRDWLNVWNDYGLGDLFSSEYERLPHILENAALAGPNSDPVVFKAIRVARNKRNIGHGIPVDPIPATRFPIKEAETMARALIQKFAAEITTRVGPHGLCRVHLLTETACGERAMSNGYCGAHGGV